MARSKGEVINDSSVSSQQGIVDILLPKVIRARTHEIPGGRTMLQTLDEKKLTLATYNWLRFMQDFRKVTISLADDPDSMSLQSVRYHEFDQSTDVPVWVSHKKQKRYLAELIAPLLYAEGLVKIEVDASGITLFRDKKNTFKSTRAATQADVDAFVEKYSEEDLNFGVGDDIPNQVFRPHLQFIPSKPKQR